MGMKHFVFLSALLALVISQSSAQAASGMGVALSTGVVFPSNNGAISNNPGRLIQGKNSFEGLVEPTGGTTDIEASYAGNSRTIGYGVQYDYINSESTAAAALGFGSAKFGLGVTGAYGLDSQNFTLNIGLGMGGNQGFSAGVLVTDITNSISLIIGGVGYRAQSFRLEADVEYDKTNAITYANPGVGVDLAGGKFSLTAGYRFQLSPSGGSGDFRGAAAFWISNKFALEYQYKGALGDHTGGFILAM